MIVYLENRHGNRVRLSARISQHDPAHGQIHGRFVQTIGPGWKLFGKTYEEWAALPEGAHEIPDDTDCTGDYLPEGVGEVA